MNHVIALLLILLTVACGSKSPTSPSATTPPPTTTPPAPVTPSRVVLAGLVSAQGGVRLSGATVAILDGPNAGRSTITNSAGEYTLADLQPSDANLAARASGYEEARGGLYLDGTRRVNFTLNTAVPWSRNGTGNTVFDMPTYITRVRITGAYSGRCQNFAIEIGNRLLVNEILGTCSIGSGRTYEGIHLTTGGVVEVSISTGVSWTITEVR